MRRGRRHPGRSGRSGRAPHSRVPAVDDLSGHVPLLLNYVADQPGNTLARAAAALALVHAARLDEAATGAVT